MWLTTFERKMDEEEAKAFEEALNVAQEESDIYGCNQAEELGLRNLARFMYEAGRKSVENQKATNKQ